MRQQDTIDISDILIRHEVPDARQLDEGVHGLNVLSRHHRRHATDRSIGVTPDKKRWHDDCWNVFRGEC